ncbi:hypothetical protein O6H91_16G003900 [Diphasiastrum complanatum]|uniref:Uncharacterized protein n=1 Tax=Diphasiastrum complanatum TaxID=34168 RepID=A0ACC2BAC7_DIPCM|nr:hypothetical protein O6H91_16G003900 [Diphasiastrum complanatum]
MLKMGCLSWRVSIPLIFNNQKASNMSTAFLSLLPAPPILSYFPLFFASKSRSITYSRSGLLLRTHLHAKKQKQQKMPWRTDPHGHNKRGLLISAELKPLDLSEDNVEQVLLDARSELLQLFDASVGITGVAELADLDGPFVKLRLKGRFWHERSVIVARLANYLKKRIPEILKVDIEDDAQLSNSPENF